MIVPVKMASRGTIRDGVGAAGVSGDGARDCTVPVSVRYSPFLARLLGEQLLHRRPPDRDVLQQGVELRVIRGGYGGNGIKHRQAEAFFGLV
jgi:hypothetical protein